MVDGPPPPSKRHLDHQMAARFLLHQGALANTIHRHGHRVQPTLGNRSCRVRLR